MKLSTRSRYGTRMMLDMALHHDQGPVQIGEIARRQGISVKYLEQIIRPLKAARFVKSVRGPRGGHYLAKPPNEITVGEVVACLEDGFLLTDCVANPGKCTRADACLTRSVWGEASRAMLKTLNAITLSDLVERCETGGGPGVV